MKCPALPATARASSTLAPQGTARYGAAHLLDGDVATAWCEGRPGAKPGDWIELSVSRSDEGSAPWERFVGDVCLSELRPVMTCTPMPPEG